VPVREAGIADAIPILDSGPLDSGILQPHCTKYLPEAPSTASITPYVAGAGADTADAGRRAVAPDALLG